MKECGAEKKIIEEIVTEDFPNLVKDLNLQVQKNLMNSNKINKKKSIPRYIIIKLLKTKDKGKITKAESKTIQYYLLRTIIQMTTHFSETMQIRRKWHKVFVLKESQHRILYPMEVFFKNQGEPWLV